MAGSPLTHDADLVGFDPQTLPLPLPSESLYSWCARFHRLSGNTNVRTTNRWLFGHPSNGLRHDFPTRLDYFSAVTREHLGPPPNVIYERTHFGLFAPFLNPAVRDQVVEAMCTPGSQSIRKRLGINRSGLGGATPWKICRHCLAEDQEKIPSGGWHLPHQYPSAWYCTRHDLPLVWWNDQDMKSGAADWRLPADCATNDWMSPAIGPRHHGILSALADWTVAITTIRNEYFDAHLLRYTYLLRAKTLGWVAMDGSLRFHTLRDAFRRNYVELAGLPGFDFLDATDGVNGGFLGQLVRDYPGVRHPLKHLLLMTFLFDAPSQFFDAYVNTRESANTDGIDGLRKQLAETRNLLRKLVGTDGKSVNSACLELGIAPTQAIRHLNQVGLEYRRRPHVLTEGLKEELDARLQAGEEREQIAAVLGIRKSFIKDYLKDRQDLRAAWEKAHSERERLCYRARLLHILAENPGVPIKRIRRIKENGFQWLYRNDREWLASHLPGIWQRPE